MEPNTSAGKRKAYPFAVRAQVVELHRRGLGSKRIASQLGLDDSLVRHWLRKYKSDGLESLHPYRRNDPKPKRKKVSLRERNELLFREAYRTYGMTLEPVASIARRHGLNYRSFQNHVKRYHPELVAKRARLKEKKI